MEKLGHVAALQKAIEIAGSQALLAQGIRQFLRDSLGKDSTISQQTVSYWLRAEILLPAEYWPAIEHVTDNAVDRAQLRPDVFVGMQPARSSVG